MFVIPQLTGYLNDHTEKRDGFYWFIVLFIIFGVFFLINNIIIWILDNKKGKKLQAIVDD